MKNIRINIDILKSRCTPLAIVLYMTLEVFQDEDNEVCLPYRAFASITGRSVSSIKSALYELYDRGYIGIFPSFYDDGAQGPNVFVIYD